jgi:diguanylate cyclase (GGDEF)-like protein/PAS domain S-box-containing protein
MRKFIASNLILLMFLVGSGAGFCLSGVAWWSLRMDERGLDSMYRLASTELPSTRTQRQGFNATWRTYTAASAANGTARDALFALSALATAFFCGSTWLAYRQVRDGRRNGIELGREHALFKTLFNATRDGILLLDADKIVDCNHAALRLFGAPSAHQLAGLAPHLVQPAVQPDGSASGPALRAKLDEHAGSGAGPCFEWTFKALGGQEFAAEVTVSAARCGDDTVQQLIVRDISSRIQGERAMRLANQAFENSLEGIAITDAARNILTVNRAFSTITGYLPEEVIGKNPHMFSSGRQSREFYTAMWRALDTQHEWQGELWNRRKNGELYPQWLNITQVLDQQGKPSNYVGVFSDISELKAAHAQKMHSVHYDQLTGLPNRALLTERLHRLFAQASSLPEHQIAVLFMDVDRLKVINDSMGRDAGDRLLQLVAARCGEVLREADTLARMNGDEFAILLSTIGNAEEAAAIAQAILRRFEAPFPLNDELIHVSLSIGVSVYPTDGLDAEALLGSAAMAMNRAKQAGGVAYQMYDHELGVQAGERMALETGLRKALERNELELHYQPQFDCGSGKLTGFEALLRWRHPEQGLIAPGAFLVVAEETGLIVPIGAWVLQTACAQAEAWRQASGEPRLMAVNLSARQLQHPDLMEHVTSALHSSGLPAACLELEITESMMMQKIDACIALMHRLAALGVEFSIDDFGTGYSSLAYLKKMPIKALKIDQSFIRDIVTDTNGASIVGAIVAMAKTLGLRVVAEGIEEATQLSHLQAYAGLIGQGYLLGRPAPALAMTAVLSALVHSDETEANLY